MIDYEVFMKSDEFKQFEPLDEDVIKEWAKEEFVLSVNNTIPNELMIKRKTTKLMKVIKLKELRRLALLNGVRCNTRSRI